MEQEREAVDGCQIQEWYPQFKSVSIKTELHELPESFIEYLLDESGPFILPLSISDDDAFPNRIHNPLDEEDLQLEDTAADSDEVTRQPPPPSFPDLELKVNESIRSLGGSVFPKLNWSAPKDSAWIAPTGTLRCSSFLDIVLLLKSSDSVVHDLCHAYDGCTDRTQSRPTTFFLALRKWLPSLHPDTEFRCFVRGRILVGISQREVTGFYPGIVKEDPEQVKAVIGGFFLETVNPVFSSQDYVFDVYVNGHGRVKLVDFNPWRGSTLPLLFQWPELERGSVSAVVELRVVETEMGVRPGLKTAVPYDYLDVGPGSGWDEFFRKADDEQRRQQMAETGDQPVCS